MSALGEAAVSGRDRACIMRWIERWVALPDGADTRQFTRDMAWLLALAEERDRMRKALLAVASVPAGGVGRGRPHTYSKAYFRAQAIARTALKGEPP